MKLYNILCTPFMKCVCLRVFCVVQNLCCFVVFQNNPVAGCVLLRGSSPIVLLPRTQFLLRLTCLSQPPPFPNPNHPDLFWIASSNTFCIAFSILWTTLSFPIPVHSSRLFFCTVSNCLLPTISFPTNLWLV
jgi:hypothetical protein